MDDGGESISWAVNMFQKLEDLYVGVDVAVREEMRIVENHLQTIGANVVNFCWDMVLDQPAQSSEDVVLEEAADDGIDILVSDASKLCINEVHHEEGAKKAVAQDIDYLVAYTSEMDTDEDHYKEDVEDEEDDAPETDIDDEYFDEDTEEEADDASEVLTDEEFTEEETDDASEIDADECEDTDEELYGTAERETDKYNFMEDAGEEAVFDRFYSIDVPVSDASNTVYNKGCTKVLLDFHKLIHSASVEPTDEAQHNSSLQQHADNGVRGKTRMILEKNFAKKKGLHVEVTLGNASTAVSAVADVSIAEAILDHDHTELDKETIDSFESMKLDENSDMTDKTEFEMIWKNDGEAMLKVRKEKTIKPCGVSAEIPEDEFSDSDWVIV